MRIENETKKDKLDLEFFLFAINEKIKELEIESESFIIHNMKMKRVNCEFKNMINRYFFKNALEWNK